MIQEQSGHGLCDRILLRAMAIRRSQSSSLMPYLVPWIIMFMSEAIEKMYDHREFITVGLELGLICGSLERINEHCLSDFPFEV
jgi:hypothetical protein